MSNPNETTAIIPTTLDTPATTGIVNFLDQPATEPAFTMLGASNGAVCVDGVCAGPAPRQEN